MAKIAILGGGSFGTALAVILSEKGEEVVIYEINEKVVSEINESHTNNTYIKDLVLPVNVQATNELDLALNDSEYIILAVPSTAVRAVANQLVGKINHAVPIVNIAKGIENQTFSRLSVVVNEILPNPVIVLSGPSHAEEVAFHEPTTLVAATIDQNLAEEVQNLFTTPRLRVYTNPDVIGVEVGGALKNVIAIAVGIADGLGYGDNTKAALMTRGIAEIARIGERLGGSSTTLLGLTGMGDLMVTCGSVHSRNRRAGYLIGSGEKASVALAKIGMVVEGVSACESFYHYKNQLDVEMPIIDLTYQVLFEDLNPQKAVDMLLNRERTNEINF